MTVVVGISGSLRLGSVSTKLARAAEPLFPAEVSYSVLDWSQVPVFNQDLEGSETLPEAVRFVRDQVAAADAILFATPEYNYSIPGPLKNLLDWLSRPYTTGGDLSWGPDGLMPMSGKAVAICGVSPFPAGGATIRAQMALRQALIFPNCAVVNGPFVALTGGSSILEEDQNGIPVHRFRENNSPKRQMERLVAELLSLAGRQGRVGRKDGVVRE